MRRTPFRPILAFAIIVLLFTSLLAVPGASARPTQSSLTLEANEKQAIAATLSDGSNPWISGGVNQSFSATYTGADGELMSPGGDQLPNGAIFYTFDGTNPSPTSSSIPLTAQTDTGTPAQTMTYTATITPSTWAAAPGSATVRFFVRVHTVGPLGAAHDFPGSGAFYQYKLDKSVPAVEDFSITQVPPTSVPIPVTNSQTPQLDFWVRDSAQGSVLDTGEDNANIAVFIDDVDQTQHYQITKSGDFLVQFVQQSSLYAGGLEFAEGDHTINITVRDLAHNMPVPLIFAVDLTPPTVSDVQAEPAVAVEANDGTLVTSRGTTVNVTANVTDEHLNLESTESVMVAFVNDTLGIASSFQEMTLINATTGTWNTPDALIPTTFPAEQYHLAVRIRAVDTGGNERLEDSATVLRIDPDAPVVVDQDPGSHIPKAPHEVRARITDSGSGLVEDKIFVHFLNIVGQFTGNTSGLATDDDGFFMRQMSAVGDSNYTATIPEAANRAVISYYVSAEDAAGNIGSSPVRTVTVDADPPVVDEVPRRFYRGASPYEFEVTVTDEGGGADPDGVTLFYSLDGGSSFQIVPMEQTVTNGSTFRASVVASLQEGDRIHYYYEAFDLAGNRGRLGSESNLLSSLIDLTPPTFSITTPPTAQGPNFEISWTGQDPPLSSGDPGSDSLVFTVFARVQGDDRWIRIVHETFDTSLDVCAESGFTYEFTGFATDFAGNAGTRSEQSLSATELTGTSCPEEVVVEVLEPQVVGAAGRIRYDAEAVSVLRVRWTAESTLTLTPSDSLAVDILFSPDGGRNFVVLEEDLENTGQFNISMDRLPNCARCVVQVRATTATDTSAEDDSAVFEIVNADPTIDLDGNGLYDAWEVTHFGRLGEADPSGDDDRDGLNNRLESEYNANPFLRDTDGDTFRDGLEVDVGTDPTDANSFPTEIQARSEQWTHWFWSVPAIWALCALVFFIGLARRW